MFIRSMVFCVFFGFIASVGTADDNLVINGGFEEGNFSGVPPGWKIQRAGGELGDVHK